LKFDFGIFGCEYKTDNRHLNAQHRRIRRQLLDWLYLRQQPHAPPKGGPAFHYNFAAAAACLRLLLQTRQTEQLPAVERRFAAKRPARASTEATRRATRDLLHTRCVSQMKAAFITCLFSAFMSLVAVCCFSAMTVIPPAREVGRIMLVFLALFLIWISLAFWLRPRPNRASLPGWARGLLVSAGVVYTVGILLLAIG